MSNVVSSNTDMFDSAIVGVWKYKAFYDGNKHLDNIDTQLLITVSVTRMA